MDEDDLIKTGMEVALRPITGIVQDLVGVAGGDWLSEKRRQNRERLRQKADEKLKSENVEKREEPSPSIAIPLVRAAQDESREALQDIWAALLAAAMNPAKSHLFRREFLDVANNLEPLDVLVLPELQAGGQLMPNRVTFLALRLQRSEDEVANSFRNLRRLELITPANRDLNAASFPLLEPLGRQFLAAIRR